MVSAPLSSPDCKKAKNNQGLLSVEADNLPPEKNNKKEPTSFGARESEGAVTDKVEVTFLSRSCEDCEEAREM